MSEARFESSHAPTSPADLNFGIAIPFYRDVELLSQALESVVAQTDTDWRCVVIDDFSPEPGARAAVCALDDPRVSYVRNETRLGVAGNFERCFAVLGDDFRLPLVAILHSDDLLTPDFVAQMRAAHRQHPDAAGVVGQVDVIGPDGRSGPILADRIKHLMWPHRRQACTLAGDAGLARLLSGQFWYCPAMSYRLDRMPSPRWDPRWHQVMDLDLYGRLFLAGEHLVLWPHEVYRYRRHGAAMTVVNTESLLRFHEEAEVSDELAGAAAARGWRRSAWAGRVRAASRLHCVLTVLSMLVRRRPRAALEAGRLALSLRAPRRRHV